MNNIAADIHLWRLAETNAILRPVSDSEQVISFFLDAEEFREWKALVFDGSAYWLLVDSSHAIASDVAS